MLSKTYTMYRHVQPYCSHPLNYVIKPAFSSFHTVFSTLSRKEIINPATLNFSSANAFELVKSKILSFGKGLKGRKYSGKRSKRKH